MENIAVFGGANSESKPELVYSGEIRTSPLDCRYACFVCNIHNSYVLITNCIDIAETACIKQIFASVFINKLSFINYYTFTEMVLDDYLIILFCNFPKTNPTI